MTPSGLLGVYQRFEETNCFWVICYEAGSGMFFRKSIIAHQFTCSYNPAHYSYKTRLLNNADHISMSCRFLHKKEKTDGPINI